MHCLELVYCKNYFNLIKIFVLRLFKMVVNQTECSRLEQRSAIKVLVADKCKPYEIYKSMSIEKHLIYWVTLEYITYRLYIKRFIFRYMQLYINTYLYVCLCVCVCVCIGTHTHTHTCTYMHAHVICFKIFLNYFKLLWLFLLILSQLQLFKLLSGPFHVVKIT